MTKHSIGAVRYNEKEPPTHKISSGSISENSGNIEMDGERTPMTSEEERTPVEDGAPL